MAKKSTDEPDTKKKAQASSDGSIAVNDAWTAMLAVSLLALVIGSGFLYWDYDQYNQDPPKVTKFNLAPPGAAPAPGPKAAPPPPKVEPAEKKDADKKDADKKDA